MAVARQGETFSPATHWHLESLPTPPSRCAHATPGCRPSGVRRCKKFTVGCAILVPTACGICAALSLFTGPSLREGPVIWCFVDLRSHVLFTRWTAMFENNNCAPICCLFGETPLEHWNSSAMKVPATVSSCDVGQHCTCWASICCREIRANREGLLFFGLGWI